MNKTSSIPTKEKSDTRRLFNVIHDVSERAGRFHIHLHISRFHEKHSQTDCKYYYLSPTGKWIGIWDYDEKDPANGYADRDTATEVLMEILAAAVSVDLRKSS